MTLKALLIAAPIAIVAACGGPAPASDTPEQPAEAMPGATVSVSDAFILQPAEGRDVTMGGLVATSVGGDARIVSASSPIAERVELHTMTREDGMMKMEQVDGFALPDGEAVALQRGGDHLMLYGLVDLDPDASYDVNITVELADGSTVDLQTQASIQPLGE